MGHIFISYSHNDTDYAHRLADALQAEGFDVWIDARIDYGSQWPLEIQKQLDSCDAFILIMTPRAFASEWVQSELQRAKRKLKPIMPLLLEGDEPWLSVESTQYYDVRGEKLPDAKFYSDLRRVAVPHEGQAVQLPADNVKKPFKPRPSAGRPKVKTETVIAILGIVATLLAAVIPIIWSNRSQNSTPSPADNVTSTLPAVPSNETPGPSATSTIASVIPSQAPASAGTLDSKDVTMQLVPAGEFKMGRIANDEFADCQELHQDECHLSMFMDTEPIRTVYLDAFYIDKYEVTNALYKACENQGVCDPPRASNSDSRTDYYGNPEFDQYPVINVDWFQAKTYCEWRGARLPTEAEWEKAARGIDERTYPWGEGLNENLANFNYSIGDTIAVGTYENGSPYGVYDMAGNVSEWVADWYDENYYQGAPTKNPPGPVTGDLRVLRGGSWGLVGLSVSTSHRYAARPADSNMDLGFRCAMDATP